METELLKENFERKEGCQDKPALAFGGGTENIK